MTKTILRLAVALLTVSGAVAQTFDTSGNGSLNGSYFVRQVALEIDPNTGVINESFSVFGSIKFDGNGNYTFSGEMLDSAVSGATAYNVQGVYSVQSNGIAEVQSLLETSAYIYGAVAQGVFSGSSTESAIFTDELIAIPAGTSSSNASLKGAYNFGTIEFLQSNGAARDTYFTLNADGNGNVAAFTLNGAASDQGNTNIMQSVGATAYSFSANGTGTLNLPMGNLIQGNKTFYISADGNFIVAGGSNTFDMLIGVRASPSPGTNATFSGTYFVTGLEASVAGFTSGAGNFDAYAGSVNAGGTGESNWHLRIQSPFYGSYDNTFDGPYNFSDGSLTQPLVTYSFGLGGQAFLAVGTGLEYQLSLGLHAPAYSGGGVYLSPIGISNTANGSPITNSVAPGEFVSLYGTGLAAAVTQARTLPFLTTLGGVQVTVNGMSMPLQYVSPTQINAVVPYGLDVTDTFFATFQVINGSSKSNKVTVFSAPTSPGVFSVNQTGYGAAAVLHANYAPVSSANPAKAGETLQMFLAGLGVVTPAEADGAPGGSDPPNTVDPLPVVVIGSQPNPPAVTVTFAGLAPTFAGLYQVNFIVPSGLASGDNYLTVSTANATASQATISISK